MRKFFLCLRSVQALIFAIILTTPSVALSLQDQRFSFSLDLDGSGGNQAVRSLAVPPPSGNRVISIQIFGTDIQSANDLSARFEYNATHVVYAGFDVGDMLPNPDVRLEEGTNPTTVSQHDDTNPVLPHNRTSFIEINIASSGGSATVNSGLVGTIRFRTTDAFSGTTIRLVRAELGRGEHFERMTLAGNVALQVSTAPSPDFDGNGKVDVDDFQAFVGAYGSRRGDAKYKSSCDLDGDGEIGLDDFLIFINSYGKVAPVAVGTLAPMLLGEHPVTVDVSGNFSDADSDTLRYAAVSSADSVATASVDGHAVTIHPVTVGVATITVTATDADGLHAMQDITVTVRFALAFSASTTRRALDENTPPGEQIGEPVAVRGFNSLTYRLSGTDADSFAIDARTGQIQTREDISYDFETKNSYWMTVEANDGQGGTARIVVIIKINDVEEPPSSPPSNFLVVPDNESLSIHYSTVPDERGKPPVRGYHAEIRRGENGPWGTLKTIYGRTNTSVYYHHIDPDGYHSRILANGQLYQIRVRAWNSEGASDWSEPVSGVPVYVPPKETPELAQFQGKDDSAPAVIDFSPVTSKEGKITVTRAALPASISQEDVEGIFVEIVVVEVSNAPDVPAQAGFTISGSSSVFDINLRARVNNRDVDIGDALQASVEICLPVPADISDPVIVHYAEDREAWEMLERQRVAGDLVCGYTDRFSLFGVGLRVNRAPVVVDEFEPQTLRVGDEGVTVDVSGNFHDPDSDILTYTAVSDDEAIATVDVSGSVVRITPVAAGSAMITVTAQDVTGSNQSADLVIFITVEPVNQVPVFTSSPTFTVDENSIEAVIVSATDADASDSITGYAIVTGGDGSQFSIVASTGVLTFKTAPNYEAPTDVEVTDPSNSAEDNEYIVVVEATSGASARELTSRDTLTITVTDVTEPPGKPSAPTVSASTVNSLTVSWSAPTNTGPAISAYDVRYILTSASASDKADDSKWTVQDDAWTNGSLEYTISSLNQNTSYDVQVRSENDEGTGDWSDSVAGTTAQNQAPVFASVSPISVAENSTVSVATVSATDADASDSITGYAISAGADGSQFSIGSSTGVLTFKVSPNYEDPADVEVTDPSNAAEDNEYIVFVEAMSGEDARALTATQTITVTVTDVTEPPGKPSAPSVADATVNSLKVSWTAPTNTGPEVSAYDVRYILTSASASDKADDSKWTVQDDAWTNGFLEYTISSLNQNTSYDIQVRSENDEGTGDWSDSVAGTTAQNQAPVITSASSFTVSENITTATTVGTVTAEDADASDSITGYAIVTGADGSQFSIGASTGVLTFQTAPNYESPADVAFTDATNSANNNAAENNEYIVVVSATSGANARALTVRDTLKVTVTDVTEAPDKPSAPTVSTSTVNSLTVSWSAPTNTGPAISAYDVRYILTSASTQDKADDTKWTVQDDAWTSGSLAYTISSLTQNTSYDVQVRAESDEGTGAWSDSVTGTTAQNQAPVFASVSPISVAENSTVSVATVSATDADASDSITGYAIVAGADGSQFSIVAATGVLTFKTAPNYESPTDVAVTTPSNAAENNEYIVVVEATSGANARVLTARQTITVTVTDVTEAPGKPSAPTVSTSTVNSLTVSWSAPTNTGPVISAYDVRYILSSASAQDKADDTKWTVQTDAWTSGTLAYTISSLTQNTGYDIQVRAESDEGTGDWSDSVTGTTAQNQAPVFASVSPISVAENSTVSVVTVSATDADASDSITGYAISAGADGSQFSIVASTGVLTFKAAPNYESPTDVEVTTPSNAAENNEYIVFVEAMSGANARALTATQTITVTVTDVTEAPNKPSAPTVASATFNSLTISWSAPTNTGPEVSAYDVRYILASASDQNKADDSNWTVVTDAWTSGPLAYTISSLPQNTSYDIQVRAENNEGTGAWSSSVTGTTAQNQAPVITSTSSFTVSENITTATTVGTVTATDADANDSITGYGIVMGADGSQFSIVSATGVLTFKAVPNYEMPTDVEFTDAANSANNNAASNNEYIIVVTATSGENARALTSRDTLTVTVTDVTEPPGKPDAPSVAEATVNSLKVSWTAPTNTGPEISAYDARYILSSASDADKADDTKWTVVTDAWTSGPLEYTISSLPQNTSYDIQVRAENDEGTGDWSDSVAGTTAQNQAPVFASVSPISVAENSTVSIATVSATDADTDDSITGYGIVDDADGSQFSIVEATGVLSFKTAPNYEDPADVAFTDATNSANNNAAGNNEYIVFVEAMSGEDARALTATQTITVTVTDVTEPPGKPNAPSVAEATVNSLKVSWSAPTNTGPEISAYDVRYILTSASDQNKADDTKWTVVADAWTNGSLEYTISSLNQNTSYDVQVRAENDEGTGSWSDSVAGTTAQNQAPVITSALSFTVSENITTATTVGTVTATDADSQDDITGYAISAGADGSQFSIGSSTGVLTFKTAPNYEAPTDVAFTDATNSANNNAAGNNEYIIVVTATSGENARALTSRDTLTVTVTDVNEAPGKPDATSVAEATVNSLKVSWSAPTNTGPEVSAYDVRYILTSVSDQDKADDNNWTVQADAWTSGSLEYTISSLPQNTSYDIQVRAESDEGTGDWSDSVAGTTAQNQAPVFASVSPISVAENSTVSIATVSATDADASDSITGYAIVAGADGSQFSIVEATGVLTFKVSPNYESPTDVEVIDPANAADNNEYIVIVSATSGENARALTSRDTLTVTVTDVNEPPGKPDAPMVVDATLNSLKVSWSAPTNTGPAISAYDMRYILSSASDQDKSDDTKWTVQNDAWTSGSLEYTISSLPQNTSYDIQVRAENDERTGAWSDSVTGMTGIAPGICDRTSQVQSAILDEIDDVTDCALVTDTHLSGITGTLNLGSQNITALKTNDFSNLSSLQTLRLNSNSLSTLPNSVFSDLSNLKVLFLGQNSLSTLPNSVFSGLSKLDTLRLNSNSLSTLPNSVFSDLSNLRVLLLDSNSLSTLPNSVFSDLSNLKVLRLNANSINALPANVFSDLSNLRVLRLNDNQLNALPAGVFSGLSSPGPTTLTLDNNPGAPFTLTLQLKRTDNTDATASGPATIVVKVAEGAPFDMIVGLSATNGTLSASTATLSAGSTESEAITVTQSGSQQVTVSLTGNPPVLPTAYRGLNTALGSPLVLFTETERENRKIYWSDNGTDKIRRSDLDGSNVEDLITRSTLRAPVGIALDISGGKIYWIDESTDKIQRASLELGQGETTRTVEDLITTGLTAPSGIALDISGGKMYWTDRASGKIQRASVEPGQGETTRTVEDLITGVQGVRGIALDISGGKMYWASPVTDKIQRSNLDGSSVEDLITTGLTAPSGIALDISGGKMYWVDRGTDKIQRASLEPGQGETTRTVEDLITGVTDPRGIALDISGGKMYWVDNGADKIQRSNLDGSNIEDVITTGLTTPVSIALNF